MVVRRSGLFRSLLCAIAFAALCVNASAEEAPTSLRAQDIGAIRDIHYGEVLFYHYQSAPFNALVNLLVSQERDRIEHHVENARLLMGGLKLEYGLHIEAEEIFRQLLTEEVSASVRDRAWFFLGKLLYQRGYLSDADQAMQKVMAEVGSPIHAEQSLIRATIALRQFRPADAIESLADWQEMPGAWRAYAQYNYGIAQMQNGDLQEGLLTLEKVAQAPPVDDEVYTLRDKANLAIGYRLLDEQDFSAAKAYLSFVRLEGPYSNQALLGSGWADGEAESYQQALAPWRALAQRDSSDPSVQEALLAIPYAYGELGAYSQAADGYQFALDAYEREQVNLAGTIDSVRDGELLDNLLALPVRIRVGADLKQSDLAGLRYFRDLMASNAFQQTFQNLREIHQLRRNLQHWQTSIDAFEDMLSTREQRYARQLPLTQDYVEQLDLDQTRTRYNNWQTQVGQAEQAGDLIFFARPAHKRQWASIESVSKHLSEVANSTTVSPLATLYGFDRFFDEPREPASYKSGGELSPHARELRIAQSVQRAALSSNPQAQDLMPAWEKARLLRGVLLWEVQADYFARKREIEKQLAELEIQIGIAATRLASLKSAQQSAPDNYDVLDVRIRDGRSRVESAFVDVERVAAQLRRRLESLAVERLNNLSERLTSYQLQARYSLAQVYDRAAVEIPETADDLPDETEVPLQ
ncbi:MAG: hypothetical protein AAF434_14250 [Pseudomonadota bacterium]